MTDAPTEKFDIARRLREAREQAGLSQGQSSRLLGMHRPTLSEIEAGRRKVSTDELVKFAELYRVSTAWLIGEVIEDSIPEITIAARELARLKPADREKVLTFLRSVSKKAEAKT